jgi:hypothetical protein
MRWRAGAVGGVQPGDEVPGIRRGRLTQEERKAPSKKRNGAAHQGGRASVKWRGEVGAVAFQLRRTALEGGGSPASTLQVGEMVGR